MTDPLTSYQRSFEALGLTLSSTELASLDALSRRIRDEGPLPLSEERGFRISTMLEPTLDALEAQSPDEMDEAAMCTIGGSVRTFQWLEEESGCEITGLVPQEYIPIAFQEDQPVVYFLGARGDRRGIVFVASTEGQDQRIWDHDQMEAIGTIEDVAAGSAQMAPLHAPRQ